MRCFQIVSARTFWGIGVIVVTLLFGFGGTLAAEEKTPSQQAGPVVVLETSEGPIKIELWADQAPVTVENFLRYVSEGFYDGTIIHRVIDDFMIQGGGFTPDMKQKATHAPIENEAAADRPNRRGTIAMARTSVVNSATSQFFINVKDNDFLNHKNKSTQGFGYAVFGKVVEGMDVVDRIKKAPTITAGPHRDVPAKPVVIEKARLLE